MGHWSAINPSKIILEKVNGEYPWMFAIYCESPYERDDGHSYAALLFRNSDRTVFGIKEYFDGYHFDTLHKLARLVVGETTLRNSLISDDPDLPRLWKRH